MDGIIKCVLIHVECQQIELMKGTKVLTLSTVGVPNYRTHVHARTACGTDMQDTSFSKTVNTWASYVGR